MDAPTRPGVLSAAVGEWLVEWRAEHGVSDESLVRAANRVGLPWSPSSVAQLEAGARELSADELVALPSILLNTDELVELFDQGSDDAPVHTVASILREAAPFTVGVVRLADDDVGANLGVEEKAAEVDAPQRREDRRPPGAKLAQSRAGETERRAARALTIRLGRRVTAAEVAATAHRMWGRLLSEERDAQLAELKVQGGAEFALLGARDHVTRALLLSMEPRMP